MPTTEGWKRRNEIEGLKFFLGVAEADRLRVLNPPDFTPALYERLLPYAVAPRRRDAMEPALRRGVGRFTDPLPAELVRREPSLEPVRHRRFQLGSERRPRDGECRRLDADCRRLNGAELAAVGPAVAAAAVMGVAAAAVPAGSAGATPDTLLAFGDDGPILGSRLPRAIRR